MSYISAESVSIPKRSIICIEGLRGTGKTEFGLSAKGPVAHQRFDLASEGALEKMRKLRPGQIMCSTYEHETPETRKKSGKVEMFAKDEIDEAIQTYEEFVKDYNEALSKGWSPVWDDAATIWEILRIARFGKVEQVPQNQYAIVNREFKKLLNKSLDANVSLITIQPINEEWQDKYDDTGKKTGSVRTGRWKMDGFKKMDYIAGTMLRLFRAGDPTDPKHTPENDPIFGHFCAQFLKCNDRGSLVGQIVDITQEQSDMGLDWNQFGIIMSKIYDETTPLDWE